MTDDRSTLDTGDGPSVPRVFLACCCVVAVVLSAAFVAPLSVAVGGAPADSLVVFDSPGGGSGSASSGLGALDPGSQTDVGGGVTDGSNPYRSLDSEVHFTVESPEPAYWRTGSYATYTGSGWKRAGDARPYDGNVSPDARGDRMTYRVTLARSATAIPTMWRPNTVDLADGADLTVTEGRALRAPSGLDAGAMYAAESTRPPREEAVLRTAGTDYPAAVEARYTALPESLSPRVARLTDEVTADAETPYERAVAIERYLETTKSYSLSASHDGDDPVASFLFEMDAGYCEYFASAMTVMLRTQDVPARYVVGYSAGESAGPGEYTVRSMNAHAWVEVYFPDAGWVRFDPTPAEERLDAERAAYERQESGTYETPGATEATTERPESMPTPAAEPATTTATSTPGSAPSNDGTPAGPTDGPTDGGTDSDARTPQSTPSLAITLDRTPVPGADVTVTVTRSGTPVPDRTVLFNGDPVGETDAAGRVVATVPYASDLTVSLAAENGTRAAVAAPESGVVPRAAAGGDAPLSVRDPALSVRASNDSVSYPLETNASLSFVGSAVTGGELLVVATVDGVPVRDAAVRVDGDVAGRTGRTGRASVTLPDDPGAVTISVSRGAVGAEETLTLDALSVAVDRPLVPLPYATTTVRTTLGNESVGGVPVSVNGERAATTDPNGTATVTLPLAPSARVVAARYGQTSAATLSGMLSNAAALLGTALVALAAVVGTAYRRGTSPLAALAGLLARAAALLDAFLAAVVSGAGLADALFDGLRAFRARLVAVARGLADRTVALADLPGLATAWVGARAARLRDGGETVAARVADRAGVADRADGPSDPDARAIRDCWDEFRGHVSTPRRASRTPGELAARAVDDGLPPESVYAIRDVFREVEYGGRSPSERSERMTRAMAEIRAAVESAENGSAAADEVVDGASGGPPTDAEGGE